MLQRVVSVKERWEGLDGRLRDLLIVYGGLLIFCYSFYFSFRNDSTSILAYMSLISIVVMWIATAYFFKKSEFRHRKTALWFALGIAILMFLLLGAAIAITGYVPENVEESVLYLLLGVPIVASTFYIAVGGVITAILSLLGVTKEGKSEEEIIEEVLDEDDDEDNVHESESRGKR